MLLTPDNLEFSETKYYSQNGEDGVIAAIFDSIGGTNCWFIEIGCGDGSECNCRRLVEHDWTGLSIDANPVLVKDVDHFSWFVRQHVTAENIVSILLGQKVPRSLDLLSIDIDGNDFWVLKAVLESGYRPRVIVAEYNAAISPAFSRTIAYDPDFKWSGTNYYGASLAALTVLAARNKYTLVYCEKNATNAFFIADECLPCGFAPQNLSSLFRPSPPDKERWPKDDRQMIDPWEVRE